METDPKPVWLDVMECHSITRDGKIIVDISKFLRYEQGDVVEARHGRHSFEIRVERLDGEFAEISKVRNF